MIGTRSKLHCAALVMLLASAPGLAQQASNWSFEDGTLQGWTATGDAFAQQPTLGNNVAPRRPGESPANDGNYWLGTFERHATSSATLGDVQGDAPQGTLISPAFRVDGQSISFLVGGGRDIAREYVALLIKLEPGMPPPGRPDLLVRLPDGDYLVASKVTGRDDEQMIRTIWPVENWRGKTARLQVVDRSSDPWGHINADSFQLSWQPYLAGTAPAQVYAVGGGSVVVLPPAQGRALPPATAHAVGGGAVVVQPPAQGRPRADAVPVVDRTAPVRTDPNIPRYRLIASSFSVEHQTADDMLERDGRGDEIFVRADIYGYDNGGEFGGHFTVKSAIFGAHGEIRAGTGAPIFGAADDQPGGLITNDRYPPRGDNFDATLATRAGDLPMVLWEGSFRPGSELLIVPSIWEWDGQETSRAETAWTTQIDQQAPTLRFGESRLARAHDATFPNAGVISPDLIVPIIIYDEGNRPIGALPHSSEPRSQSARVPVNSILLTAETAERLVNEVRMFSARSHDPDGTVVGSVEYPGPPGGFMMRMVDPAQLEGDYTLFLRLVRVN